MSGSALKAVPPTQTEGPSAPPQQQPSNFLPCLCPHSQTCVLCPPWLSLGSDSQAQPVVAAKSGQV